MKRKWICIIGSVLLAPIVLALGSGVVIGICWVINQFIVLQLLVLGTGGLGILMFIWWILYIHCEEYWSARKNNKPVELTGESGACASNSDKKEATT